MLIIYPPEAWDMTFNPHRYNGIGYASLMASTLSDEYMRTIIARIELFNEMTNVLIRDEPGKLSIPRFSRDGYYWLRRPFYHMNRNDKSPDLNKIKEYTINICKEYLNCKVVKSKEDILKYRLLL